MRKTLIFTAAILAASAPLYAQSCREADAAVPPNTAKCRKTAIMAAGNGAKRANAVWLRRANAFTPNCPPTLPAPNRGAASSPDCSARARASRRRPTAESALFLGMSKPAARCTTTKTCCNPQRRPNRPARRRRVRRLGAADCRRHPARATVKCISPYSRFVGSSRLYLDRVELLHIEKGRLKPLNIIRTARLGNTLSYEADLMAEPRLPEGRENNYIAYDAKTRTLSLPLVVDGKESDGDGRVTAGASATAFVRPLFRAAESKGV